MSFKHTSALHEILLEVEKAKTKEQKIKVLHANSFSHLKSFLDYVFNPKIKWVVPLGDPPYKPSEEDKNVLKGRIWQDFRLLLHFLSIGPYPNMDRRKRENLFISMLQTIHPEDAKLILYVKDNRELPYKTVTKKLIEEAFPIISKNWS